MKLEGMIPFINVRYVAVDGTSKSGTRVRLFMDCDDLNQRERLFKYRNWEIIGIQAGARFINERLWAVLTLIINET